MCVNLPALLIPAPRSWLKSTSLTSPLNRSFKYADAVEYAVIVELEAVDPGPR